MGCGNSKSNDPAVGALARLIEKVESDQDWKGALPKFGKSPSKVAKKVDILDLSSCKLDAVAGASLGACLPLFPALLQLNVSNCEFHAIGVAALSTALAALEKTESTIVLLNLSSNYDEAMQEPEASTALGTALKSDSLKNLASLDLSDNGIGGRGAIMLARALEEAKLPITELLLADCQLGFTGGQALIKACVHLSKLQRLDLFNCNIGNDAATSIGEMLTTGGMPLITLGLQSNAIQWEGVVQIAKGLPGVSKTLENLDLSSNAVGNECNDGINAMADAIQASPPAKLNVLNLAENHLGDGDPSSLLKALGKLSALEWLDLASNRLRPESVEDLLQSLPNMSNLRIFCLNDNDKLGANEKMADIFDAALKLPKLTEFHASKTNLQEAAAKAAAKLVSEHGAISTCVLRRNVELEQATCAAVRDAAGGGKDKLVLPDTDSSSDPEPGPLDARKMHYEYHGSKKFVPVDRKKAAAMAGQSL